MPGEKIALCLSGGGFRATLFHLGSLVRLNELGILSRVATVSSVSGGSITNGVLATRWSELGPPNSDGVFERFTDLIVEPIKDFCTDDLRTDVLLWDRVNPINWVNLLRSDYSVTDRLAVAYGNRLQLDVLLSHLPRAPDFVFCAANMGNGVSWEFHADHMGDYHTGRLDVGEVNVAQAVAASSSYPVTFPPLILALPDNLGSIALTDGGVYDNLGLEPVSEMAFEDRERPEFETLLVSDAGAPLERDEALSVSLTARVTRSLGVIWNQTGALRKRWLIARFKDQQDKLNGTYWGLTSKVDNYDLAGAPGFRGDALHRLVSIRTDLDPFSEGEIACLMNHGYAMANVAATKWVDHLIGPSPSPPFAWPNQDFVDEQAVEAALQESHNRGIWNDVWNSIKSFSELD